MTRVTYVTTLTVRRRRLAWLLALCPPPVRYSRPWSWLFWRAFFLKYQAGSLRERPPSEVGAR